MGRVRARPVAHARRFRCRCASTLRSRERWGRSQQQLALSSVLQLTLPDFAPAISSHCPVLLGPRRRKAPENHNKNENAGTRARRTRTRAAATERGIAASCTRGVCWQPLESKYWVRSFIVVVCAATARRDGVLLKLKRVAVGALLLLLLL